AIAEATPEILPEPRISPGLAGHIEIARTGHAPHALILAAEMARQHHHFSDRLVEQDRRRIVIERAVLSLGHALETAAREPHRDGKEVLEGGTDLDAGHIRRHPWMIIASREHRAQISSELAVARCNDDAGMPARRELAGDAR